MIVKISPLTLYKIRPDIFDGFTLFDGPDRNLAVKTCVFDSAFFSAVYTDPEILKSMITVWHDKNVTNWERIWKALIAEYNPIWNVDGSEKETYNREATSEIDGTDQKNRNLSGETSTTGKGETTTTDKTTDKGTTIESVMGDNQAPGYVGATKTETDDVTTGNGTEKTSDSSSGKSSEKETETGAHSEDRKDAETWTRELVRTGNIGVTKSSELVADELSLRLEHNFYNVIADSFKENFCLLIY